MKNNPAILDQRLPGLTKPVSSDRLSILVYGAPGVGKTVLAGTAEDDPRTAPVLFCEAEGGLMSISHRGVALDVLRITNFSDDMNALVKYFQACREDPDNPSKYKTVVLDSLTEAAWLAMRGLLTRPNPKRESPDALEYGEWNTFTNRLRNLITFFRDLNIHVIMTALERDEEGKILPSLPGKQIAAILPGFFNTVARLSMSPAMAADGKTVILRRRLLLQSDVKYVAKDRSDRLGTMARDMDDPTVTKLLDRIAEGHQRATDSRSAPSDLKTTKPTKTESDGK